MSFAVIETGGKQYKVSASNILKVEKLNITKGNKVEFKVLLVNDDKTTELEINNKWCCGRRFKLDNIKDRKILVLKKKKTKFKKKYGHRQPLSKIQITKILSKGGKVISEIEADKIKLSNDQKSDKKLGIKKQQVTKKTTRKKTVVKTKSKK